MFTLQGTGYSDMEGAGFGGGRWDTGWALVYKCKHPLVF